MLAQDPPLQEPQSFSNLYTRTQLIIFRYIYGIHGGPREEVEDMTSDTFLRAWKARSRFHGGDHDALCWLFTIARHMVIDAHRKKRSHPQILENFDDLVLERISPNESHTPEEITGIQDQYARLWKALQKLPDDRREMLVLRYMVGWQVKQIAAFISMEENTVSVYIRRSIDQIRQDWTEP